MSSDPGKPIVTMNIWQMLSLAHDLLRKRRTLDPKILARLLIWDMKIAQAVARAPGSCQHCGERIAIHDITGRDLAIRFFKDSLPDYHSECVIRIFCGSAAHILRECICYGGEREDPPGMSRHDAARLSASVFRIKAGYGLQ